MTLDRLDSLGMWDVTFGLADQLATAAARVASPIAGLPRASDVDQLGRARHGG